MDASTPAQAEELLLTKAVQSPIEAFVVHGVNSLKTFDPPPSALEGQTVTSVHGLGPSTFEFVAGGIAVEVDLQRTGRLRWTAAADLWRPGAPAMPTAQLLLADGSGIAFVEPGKTKRVAFRLRRA